MTDHTVPPIGMRMVKTAAAVLICLLVSMAVDREDMRIYSSIAALLCVQPYAEDTKRMAIQRIVGTAIGSVFGIATLLLEMDLDIQGTLVGYIVIAAVTVPNLWIAVVLKSSNAAALSGIVFLSITPAPGSSPGTGRRRRWWASRWASPSTPSNCPAGSGGTCCSSPAWTACC